VKILLIFGPFLVFVLMTNVSAAFGQELSVPHLAPGSVRKASTGRFDPTQIAVPPLASLTVPEGAALQVALDEEVRVTKVGRRIHGRVVEPVYALDRLVIPVGSEVTGQITKIESISGAKRTLAVLNADLSPLRNVELGFSELVLPDGRHLPLQTNVTLDSGQVLQFATAPDTKGKKSTSDIASEKIKQAKQQARQQWEAAMKQLNRPGRVRRLERYVEARLPVHRQYIPAGTVYFAELKNPLDFGSEVTPFIAQSGSPLPDATVVRARLLTPLSSATALKGERVEAVLSRPLFTDGQLILPQGSLLKGKVQQVEPARRMKKNGELRIAFLELVPPDGVAEKVHATLEGVQAQKDGGVKLDSEGGAEATTSKSRYLATSVSVGLAAVSMGDDLNNRVAGGAGGFKIVGIVVGAISHSRIFGYSMGVYGAGMSVYSHFIARGHEVVFPKNTAMEIGLGTGPR
jgi:hypothetical protein